MATTASMSGGSLANDPSATATYGVAPALAPSPKKGKGRWFVIGAAVLALAVAGTLFLVLRPSTAIQTADGDVANAREFLDSVRKTWRSGLPNEGVRIGEKAGCYYEVDPDRNELTGTIACGPVRYLGTDDGKVWDLYKFRATKKNSAGDPVASAPSNAEVATVRPQGDLRDADGNEPPADADKLAEPDLPSAEPDLLITDLATDSIKATDVQKPGDAGRVVTPDGVMQINSIGNLDAAYIDGQSPQKPADGYKFILVTTAWTASENADYYSTDFGTSFILDVDGSQTEITDTIAQDGGKVSFIASVPVDGTSTLITSYENHDQKTDLSTGARQPDPVTDVWYRQTTEQNIAKSETFGPTVLYTDDQGSSEDATYQLTIEHMYISAYAGKDFGGLGWAAEGTMWLLVTYDEDPEQSCCGYYNAKSNHAGWTVAADGGAPLAVQSFPDPNEEAGAGYATFSVPATATAFSLNLTTTVSFSGSYPDASADFGPMIVDVTFPV